MMNFEFKLLTIRLPGYLFEEATSKNQLGN